MGVKRGKLIAFEGLDGCGKSTQLDLVAVRLEDEGYEVVRTREPTNGPVGQRIRKMARSGELVAPEQELAWFVEDRTEHVASVIEPALAAGKIVLTDRYTLSSVAYQGARGLSWRKILAAGEARFPLPDLALVFKVPARVGLDRVHARGGVAEPAFERLDFLEKVEEIFETLDCAYVARIDGTASPAAVCDAVTRRIGRFLASSRGGFGPKGA